MPVSITLGLWSTLLAYLISIPLGIRKAVHDGSRFDTATSGVIIVAYAIPSFLFAVMLLVLFAGGSYWRIFPLRGLTSDNWADLSLVGKVLDYLWHITLPVIASTIGAFATMTLLTKNSFLDEIKKQYVVTARAKGLSERRVLYGHVFRNAMLIVIAGFPAIFICVFFGGSADHRDDLLARRPRPARLRERDAARLSGGLRHALRLRPDRARRRAPLRPHLRLGRPAHRLREPRDLMRLTPIQRRRLANFRANRRAFWSLWIFLALFLVTLCAEFVANDRPLVVRFQGQFYFPVFQLLLRGRLRRRVRRPRPSTPPPRCAA